MLHVAQLSMKRAAANETLIVRQIVGNVLQCMASRATWRGSIGRTSRRDCQSSRADQVAVAYPPKIVACAVMDLPAKKIWQIVSDCAHYKGRLPRVASSELVKRAGNVHTCEVTIAMPYPLSNLTATTEAVHEESDQGHDPPLEAGERRLQGERGKLGGEASEQGGTTSLVIYTVHAEPNTAVPAFVRERSEEGAARHDRAHSHRGVQAALMVF